MEALIFICFTITLLFIRTGENDIEFKLNRIYKELKELKGEHKND